MVYPYSVENCSTTKSLHPSIELDLLYYIDKFAPAARCRLIRKS